MSFLKVHEHGKCYLEKVYKVNDLQGGRGVGPYLGEVHRTQNPQVLEGEAWGHVRNSYLGTVHRMCSPQEKGDG